MGGALSTELTHRSDGGSDRSQDQAGLFEADRASMQIFRSLARPTPALYSAAGEGRDGALVLGAK